MKACAFFLSMAGLAALGFGWFIAAARAADFPGPARDAPLAAEHGEQSIVLAGGCFWGVEAVFEHLKGVKSAVSGYAGGTSETADYKTVSGGETGHAEAVEVVYDPAVISLEPLEKFYAAEDYHQDYAEHHPTQPYIVIHDLPKVARLKVAYPEIYAESK